jgi:putative FmdB family regulatory protein
MPFYSFHCESCGTTFDVRASIEDKENGLKPKCPNCHAQDARQVFTAGVLIGEGAQAGLSPLATGPACRPGSGCCG